MFEPEPNTHSEPEPKSIFSHPFKSSLPSTHTLITIPTSQETMANFLAAAHQNAQDIMVLQGRFEEMEKMMYELIGRKRSIEKASGGKGGPRPATPVEKMHQLVQKSAMIEKFRNAVIQFNEDNSMRNKEDMLSWNHTTDLKDGKTRTMTFTKIDSNASLKTFIESEHMGTLFDPMSSDPVNITPNFLKRYRVIIIDNKLVPLSKDFKDGIGAEYIWTSDIVLQETSPASSNWKNNDKKMNDPRRTMVDPQTMELWKPEDEMNTDDAEVASSNEKYVEEDPLGEEEEEESDGYMSDEQSRKKARVD